MPKNINISYKAKKFVILEHIKTYKDSDSSLKFYQTLDSNKSLTYF